MILDTKVSYFNNTVNTEVKGQITIKKALDIIKNGKLKDKIDKLRAGNKEIKINLPTVAFHGIFEFNRKKEYFIESSGIVILDIDNIKGEIEKVKHDIMDCSDHILAVMISPSGNSLKVLYYVNPLCINAKSYRSVGIKLVEDLKVYGKIDYLSVTDCLIMTYDPKILINENCEPDFIYTKDIIVIDKVEFKKVDKTKELWTDVEDFFKTVLCKEIEKKTSNNYHFIQVAVLDLAKFGFYHPEHDLSFVVEYSENCFKQSTKNKQRFISVAALAIKYPQTEWAYKIKNSYDSEDDFYEDYSEYQNIKDKKDIEEDLGIVDYSKLYNKVIENIKEGNRVGFETSHILFADKFRFKGTGILVVTGIPTMGKTEVVDSWIIDLARLYEHQTIVAGFEQSIQEHIVKLVRRFLGLDITANNWMNVKNQPIFNEAYKFVTKYIKHIDTDMVGGNISSLLEIATKYIKKSRDLGNNPKYLVLDPFNLLSLKYRGSGHEKIEEMLRRITHFSHKMKVMCIVVAHPLKMTKDEKTGQYKVPDLYSVKGSSAFFDMAYSGIVIHRRADGYVLVKILKVKQNNLGEIGAEILFMYDKSSGRYVPVDENCNEMEGDHHKKDWLETHKKKFN